MVRGQTHIATYHLNPDKTAVRLGLGLGADIDDFHRAALLGMKSAREALMHGTIRCPTTPFDPTLNPIFPLVL